MPHAEAPTQDAVSDTLSVVDNRTGQQYTIPIAHNAIDASGFRQIKAPSATAGGPDAERDQPEHGLRVFDPGFGNTCVSESKVTFVDGRKGTVQYRGYSIDDIVLAKKSFAETSHLLIWGQWPSASEAADLQKIWNAVPRLPQHVFDTIHAFPKNGSPLGMVIAGLSALQSQDMENIPAHVGKNLYLHNDMLVTESINRLLPGLAMIVAAAYCHSQSRVFTPPSPTLNFVDNFLVMMGHVDSSTGLPNPRYAGYVETLWTLLADHEMTCSTAALLQTASALPDPITALISAIAALYGPLHGGAIEVAYKDIAAMASTPDGVTRKMEAVKAGKERLYGYGHRVYKVADPRYKHIARILGELRTEIEADSLLKTAFEVNEIAREDEYFKKRGLGPNADLFAGFCWGGMGFPPEWILVISLIGRTQGFLAHWREAMSGPPRIWRPGQVYTGELNRKLEV